MTRYQISSRNRHLRYIFFVDVKYPYEKLVKLIQLNQRHWGGRYNPIVPVKDGNILDGYVEVIKHYDPDIVFYTDGFNPETIKKLRLFNPTGYFNFDEQPRKEDWLGIDALYFISQYDAKSAVLMPEAIWKTESPLLDFYTTNFGLTTNGIVSDYEISKNYNQIIIKPENFNTLNEIIHLQKPINQANLSKRNLNTKILRGLRYASYNSFEIVIAKDKTAIADLFYYWNRALFECYGIMYVTIEELLILCQDKYFGGMLYDLSSESSIDVVSFSLSKEQVEELIKLQLTPIAFNRRFQYKTIDHFPFEITDANGLYEREYGEQTFIQTILSEEGMIFAPKLSFTDKVGFYPQKWAVDIEIRRISSSSQNQLKFPLTTDTRFIVKQVPGRINRSCRISFFIHNQVNSSGVIDINVPSFPRLLAQLTSEPIHQGEAKKTKYIDLGPHDSSNKLSSFVKSFNSNFDDIHEYFTDKFWVDIFEELCKSEKVAGDTITFHEVVDRCKQIFEKSGKPLGKKGETYRNEENLSLGLSRKMRYLCNSGVFLQGFKLKCPTCSSSFWYHVKEVSNHIECKGCIEQFKLPIEPKFSYKLSDLIRNNIFQTKSQRDGNLTVIRSLVSLGARGHYYAFEYNPQLNLYDDYNSKKPCAEIDIVCCVDGSLIIGEAKHNSNEFRANNHKSLMSLIDVATAIYPDKVFLSCYVDEHSKLERAKQFLEHNFSKMDYPPVVETLLLHQPDYFNLSGNSYWAH